MAACPADSAHEPQARTESVCRRATLAWRCTAVPAVILLVAVGLAGAQDTALPRGAPPPADAPGEAAELLEAGLEHYRQARYEEALSDLRRSFTLDEKEPRTSLALGLCLVRLGREDLAETFFEIAVGLDPGNPAAHYYLGLNAYTTKRFDSAARAFEQAVLLRPGSVAYQTFLGRTYEAQGKSDLARRLYTRANRINQVQPTPSAEPPLLFGSMLYRQSRLEHAERFLKEALVYDPRSALAHYWLGLVYERRSDLPSAIRALLRAAAEAPADHRPHYALARVYRRTGDARRANDALHRFRELRVRSESETF